MVTISLETLSLWSECESEESTIFHTAMMERVQVASILS